MLACREPVGGPLGPSALVQSGVFVLYKCVYVRMCLSAHLLRMLDWVRSTASVAPAHSSLPQTINSVIATPRRTHRPKQSEKRKGVIDGGSCSPNEFNDWAIWGIASTATGLIEQNGSMHPTLSVLPSLTFLSPLLQSCLPLPLPLFIFTYLVLVAAWECACVLYAINDCTVRTRSKVKQKNSHLCSKHASIPCTVWYAGSLTASCITYPSIEC